MHTYSIMSFDLMRIQQVLVHSHGYMHTLNPALKCTYGYVDTLCSHVHGYNVWAMQMQTQWAVLMHLCRCADMGVGHACGWAHEDVLSHTWVPMLSCTVMH